MIAAASLNSQPVPGWAIESKVNNKSINKNKKSSNNSINSKSDQKNSSNKAADKFSVDIENNSENNLENKNKLSESEKLEVRKLQQRDREVRAHEMAHQAAGGQYAGSASYTYQTGPDNRRYAVGGSVNIDTSPEKNPEETIKKADQVKRAATAPAKPSAKDLQIAAKAARMKLEAQAELNKEKISGESESENEVTNENEINYNSEDQLSRNRFLINKREESYEVNLNGNSSNTNFYLST